MTRRLGIAGALLGLLAAAPYVALPGNETAAQGPADPVLGLRKRVVGLLRSIGAWEHMRFFVGCDWLPSVRRAAWVDDERRPICRMRWTTEPVYRGLLLVTGTRVTIDFERLDAVPLGEELRLWYEQGGRRRVVAVAHRGNGGIADGGERGRVSGFVPRGVDAYGYDEIDTRGAICGSSSLDFR